METATEGTTSSPQAPETILATRLDEILINAKPRPRPAVKPLGEAWIRKWLELEITHPDVRDLAKLAAAMATRWFHRGDGKRWAVACGFVGTGKTHVSRRLHRWSKRVAFEAWRASWAQLGGSELPDAIHRNWLEFASPERCDAAHWESFLDSVRAASWVFVDDVGTETDQYRTGIPAQRLCELLNVCEEKFLWLTMNIPPDKWAEKWDKRVEDRLLSAEVVEINAPSYRSEVSG